MQIFIKGKIKKKKQQHTYTRGEQCVNRLLRSPNCDGSAVQSFPKAIERPFITQGYQTSYSHDVCFYTLSWHGMVTCVESIPFFSIPLQRVQGNTTPSFYHTIWRLMFRIRITESCLCFTVTGVMETHRQIANLQDAWCHSEQHGRFVHNAVAN